MLSGSRANSTYEDTTYSKSRNKTNLLKKMNSAGSKAVGPSLGNQKIMNLKNSQQLQQPVRGQNNVFSTAGVKISNQSSQFNKFVKTSFTTPEKTGGARKANASPAYDYGEPLKSGGKPLSNSNTTTPIKGAPKKLSEDDLGTVRHSEEFLTGGQLALMSQQNREPPARRGDNIYNKIQQTIEKEMAFMDKARNIMKDGRPGGYSPPKKVLAQSPEKSREHESESSYPS